jgi:hypothetical protein
MQVKGTEFIGQPSKEIDVLTARNYLNNYLLECARIGEDPALTLKALRIDKSAIVSIFETYGDTCQYIRLYFGKLTAPGFELLPDHTIIVVGVGDDNENLVDEGGIFDNCDPCPRNCPLNDF